MMRKILPIILIFVLCSLAFGQEDSKKTATVCRGSGIILGKAICLPKPIFPQGGNYKPLLNTIIVSVTIDENGKVIEANAISGHPLFRQISVDAAIISKFSQSIWGCEKKITYSEIAYTFDGSDLSVSVRESPIRYSKYEKLGIINALATILPKPIYPRKAKDFCVGGKVEIEVLVDENGNVIDAKAISGDKLLRESAIESVKQAKFNQNEFNVKLRGIIVYNFDSLAPKCLVTDRIVNNRAIYLPKPNVKNIVQPKHLHLKTDEIVKVEIIVNEEGKVTNSRAISGHPLLHKVCENAARNAKFRQTLHPSKIRVKAFLVYKIKPNGEVETKF